MPSNASVLKEMNKLKILTLKDFFTLQKLIFINNCLEEESIKSTFKRSKTTKYHSTRSTGTYQLEKRDIKTKKYGCFSKLNKCLSDRNHLQNKSKTNFKRFERS